MHIIGKVAKVIIVTIIVIVVVIIAAIVIFLAVAGYRESHYYNYAKPVGKIEKKYTALGDKQVSYIKYDAADKMSKEFKVWYPSDIDKSDKKYPLVIMVNGTGYTASHYKEVFNHLASWDFIVAGNEDGQTRTGASTEEVLEFMLKLNEDTSSPFYGKIDTENIGVGGHSQGGVGTINAVTNQKNGNMYKAMWTASATSTYWGQDDVFGSEWSYDVSKINIPYLMVAGTGYTDAGSAEDINPHEGQGICPLWSLTTNFDNISNDVPKVMGRLKGRDHGDLCRFADGYMTAWFMYWLKGDEEAGKAFFGENPEMATNSNWQDVRINDVR